MNLKIDLSLEIRSTLLGLCQPVYPEDSVQDLHLPLRVLFPLAEDQMDTTNTSLRWPFSQVNAGKLLREASIKMDN